MIEIARLGYSQHRAENFFLKDSSFGINVGDHRGLDEIPVSRSCVATCDKTPFAFSGLDVIENRLFRARANHGAHVIFGLIRGSYRQGGHFLLHFFKEIVIDFLVYDRARASRTLLALVAICRLDYSGGGAFQVGLAIHDNRVLAAHFGDDALDPDLALSWLRGELVNPQSHVARPGE